MKRLIGGFAVLAAIALLTTPSVAGAAPGWKLPKVKSTNGDRVYTSTAMRCGASQFGTWTFRNALKLPDRRGYAIYRAKLTQNGALHKPKLLRFGGNLGSQVEKRTRRLLRNVKFRYNGGPPRLVESVRQNGNIQATRPFDPVRKRC
jgi:hypothetical protein